MTTSLVRAICLVALLSTPAIAGDVFLGVGAGVLRLPDNYGAESLVAPQGESDEGIMVYLGSLNPNRWGIDLLFEGYRFSSAGATWTVPCWSILAGRSVALSDSLSSIGVLGGPSFLFPELQVDPSIWDVTEAKKSYPSAGFTLGIELQIVLHRHLVAFVFGSKTFAKSDLLQRVFHNPDLRSVSIGPSGTYGGLAYRF